MQLMQGQKNVFRGRKKCTISCRFRRELEAEVSNLREKVETLEAKYVLRHFFSYCHPGKKYV